MEKLRVASVGTGPIVDWFLEALAETETLSYIASYSRSLERAKAFGAARGATLFFDSLEELAACPTVDAVYIASPNALHMPQAKLFLKARKHVLCEKPLASNRLEALDAFACASAHEVTLMEGMRTLHTPGFEAIRNAVLTLGPLKSASLRFAKTSSRAPALLSGQLTNSFNPELSGGALMDIGVYCAAFMTGLWGLPKRSVAMGSTFDASSIGACEHWPMVDLTGEALCDYGSFIVNLSWGKLGDNQLPSQIVGEQATLVIDELDQLDTYRLIRPVSSSAKYGAYGSGEGVEEIITVEGTKPLLKSELTHFAQAALGTSEIARHYQQISLDTLAVMDEIRAQLGVRYPADEALNLQS